jgi:hypothetical protein
MHRPYTVEKYAGESFLTPTASSQINSMKVRSCLLERDIPGKFRVLAAVAWQLILAAIGLLILGAPGTSVAVVWLSIPTVRASSRASG